MGFEGLPACESVQFLLNGTNISVESADFSF